ncbi:MAG: LytTR family DNA-binding domain-containing protein [Pseudomonadota bacterium]
MADSIGSGVPRNLRLGAVLLVFITINQIEDPLINATLQQELLYWTARLAILAVGLWGFDIILSRIASDRLAHPSWLQPVVMVSALGLIPFSIAEIFMEPHLPMRPEYMDDELWSYSPVLAWLSEYLTIVSILLPIHLVIWLLIERRTTQHPVALAEAPLPLPEFLQKSSVRDPTEVLALQAEEHYVRVFSRDGEELVHHRLGDAADAMPATMGLRVHRSWWVAQDAVQSAKRGARRWQLTLHTGLQVPVSDSYLNAARERGLLPKKS